MKEFLMKHHAFFSGLAILFCGTVLFTGCQNEPGPNYAELLVEVSAGETKYYSLSTGQAVSNGDTAEWDIAFEKEAAPAMLGPRIYTNSGATATAKNSGGNGGVWYTDKTNFDSVALDNKKEEGEYAGFIVDTEKTVRLVYPGVGTITKETKMNVMTYLGYVSGDGSVGTPYEANTYVSPPAIYVPYEFNKKQFYKMFSFTLYEATNQVYIVRHGDGVTYSRVQITAFGMAGGKDQFAVRYQKF
jgi:hypothetical protein